MKMNKEVTELILNGGIIVSSQTHTVQSHLIRMPKGKFIKDDTSPIWGVREFEFVIIEDFYDDGILRIATYYNDTLARAKKKLYAQHEERCFNVYRKRLNKENA